MHNITERGKKPLLLPATLTCWSFNCNLNEKDSKFQWSFHSDNLDTVYFYFKKNKNKMNFFIFIWEGCPLAVPTSKWRCPLLEPVSVAVEMLLLMLLMPLPTNFLLAAIAQRWASLVARVRSSVSFFFFLKSFKKFPFCTCARNRRSHWFRLFVKTFKFEYSS